MSERRGASHHRQRVSEALREQIDIILEGELRDPRIGLCHVTEVVMNQGGKSARILVSVMGTDEEAEQTMEGLATARAWIRSEVRSALGVRHVPELTFHLDRSEQVTGRIDEILGRVKKRERKKA
jgi:ribosome-binding factor A